MRPAPVGPPAPTGRGCVVQLGTGQAHQGDLEDHTGVGGLPHVDLGLAERLHVPGRSGAGRGLRPSPSARPARWRSTSASVGGQGEQESLPELVDQLPGQLRRAPTRPPTGPRSDQRHLTVLVGQGLEHGGHAEAGRPRPTPRPRPGPERRGRLGPSPGPAGRRRQWRLVADGEGRSVADLAQQLLQRVGSEKAELEVLGPAPDGRQEPSGDRSWPARRPRGRVAPRASSTGRWPPRWRACGPRRRCRPSSGRGCPRRRGR